MSRKDQTRTVDVNDLCDVKLIDRTTLPAIRAEPGLTTETSQVENKDDFIDIDKRPKLDDENFERLQEYAVETVVDEYQENERTFYRVRY